MADTTTKTDWWNRPDVRERLQNAKMRSDPNYRVGTYTGLGGDGRLQPGNVTSINNFALHEGEYVIPADKVLALGGPRVLDKQLGLNRAAVGLPGYQSGGVVGGIGAGLPPINNIEIGDKENFAQNQNNISNLQQASEENADRLLARLPVTTPTPALTPRPVGTTAAGSEYFSIAAKPPSAPGTGTVGAIPITPPASPVAQTTTTTLAPAPTPKTKMAQYDQAFNLGLSRLKSMALGNDPIFRQQANTILEQLNLAGAGENASLRQQIAEMGLKGGAGLAATAAQERDIRSSISKTAGELALGAQQRALSAAQAVADEGYKGMVFDYNKQQDAFNALVTAKDWVGAGKAFENLYGTQIDLSDSENQNRLTNLSAANSAFRAAIDPTGSVGEALGSANVRAAAQTIWDNMPDSVKKNYTSFDDFFTREVNTAYFQKTPLGETMATWDNASIAAMFPDIPADQIPKARGTIMALVNAGGIGWDSSTGTPTFNDTIIGNILGSGTTTTTTGTTVTEIPIADLISDFNDVSSTSPFGPEAEAILTNTSATDKQKNTVYTAQGSYLLSHPEKIKELSIQPGTPVWNEMIRQADSYTADVKSNPGIYKVGNLMVEVNTDENDNVFVRNLQTGKTIKFNTSSGFGYVDKKIPLSSGPMAGGTITELEPDKNGRLYGKTASGKYWSSGWETVIGWLVT